MGSFSANEADFAPIKVVLNVLWCGVMLGSMQDILSKT